MSVFFLFQGCTTVQQKPVANVPLDVAKHHQPEEVWQARSICRPGKHTTAYLSAPVSEKWRAREYAKRTLYVHATNSTITGVRTTSRALVCDRQSKVCREHSAILTRDSRYAILGTRKQLQGKYAAIISGDARGLLLMDGTELTLPKKLFGKGRLETDPLRIFYEHRDHDSVLHASRSISSSEMSKIRRDIDSIFTKGQTSGRTIGGCNRLATYDVAQFAGVTNLGDKKERYLHAGGGVISSNDVLSHGTTFALRQAVAGGKAVGGKSQGLYGSRKTVQNSRPIYEH